MRYKEYHAERHAAQAQFRCMNPRTYKQHVLGYPLELVEP